MDRLSFLTELIAIPGASSDESKVKAFLIDFIQKEMKNWKCEPQLINDPDTQDTFALVFGTPRTAIYAHIDTIGFSVGYERALIKIGGPRSMDGIQLVGSDCKGHVEAELMVIDDEDGSHHLEYVCERTIDRGTILTFKPNFRETADTIQSPYLDNRLGVWVALEVARTMENGAIVFTSYEEHGGNSVGYWADYLKNAFATRQALISDITWVTHGVVHNGGVAISMRDSGLPRRVYLNRIIELARESGIPFQLEVESAGGSDGTMIQKSSGLIDWCFIGAPEDHVHTPDELVYKSDVQAMIALYSYLVEHL
jgi:putative aminopeptidase FrvX